MELKLVKLVVISVLLTQLNSLKMEEDMFQVLKKELLELLDFNKHILKKIINNLNERNIL
jgi:hypothetical protein